MRIFCLVSSHLLEQSGQGIQPALQVSLDVLDVLQPYRNPDEVFGDADFPSFLVRETSMSRRRRVGNRRPGVTQVRSDGNHPSLVYHMPGPIPATPDFESDDTASAGLLFPGQRLLRVRW